MWQPATSACASWTANWKSPNGRWRCARALNVIKSRQAGGVATLLDLRQAEQLASIHSRRNDSRTPATDRADGEPDQPAAREESGRSDPRAEPDRAGVATP